MLPLWEVAKRVHGIYYFMQLHVNIQLSKNEMFYFKN